MDTTRRYIQILHCYIWAFAHETDKTTKNKRRDRRRLRNLFVVPLWLGITLADIGDTTTSFIDITTMERHLDRVKTY